MSFKVSVRREKDSSLVQRFATVQDAEDYIAMLEPMDPEAVARGDYYIDAPEEMVNPMSEITLPFTSLRDQEDAASFIQTLVNNGVHFKGRVEDRFMVITFPKG